MFPQVIHSLSTALPILNTIALLGLLFYFRNKYLTDFPGKRTIHRLQLEVSEFHGTVADLVDRFNRFQKKENMRAVRADRTAELDILEQAKQIAAQGGSQEPAPGSSDKLNLYKRRGH